MIRLHFKATFDGSGNPFIVKAREAVDERDSPRSRHDAIIRRATAHANATELISEFGMFSIDVDDEDSIDGDVLLCSPTGQSVHRLFRRRSSQNSLLLTERCDQLCVMCSQPPKKSDDEWRFQVYRTALELTDPGARIGITGGEPTLYKRDLLNMLTDVSKSRPDISYHILSNAQHFTPADQQSLKEFHSSVSVTWGIPLYSAQPSIHDEIVGKRGAFQQLMNNLMLLGSTGAQIELRTVFTSINALDLPHLASFISKHLPFVSLWAIMGMESIGYAIAHWDRLFFDHSVFPQPIISALEIARLHSLPCKLYNFPRCTIPAHYREACTQSISDWKRKFLEDCSGCAEREKCCGFFEWYAPKYAWAGVKKVN
ncbi:His-Xaa-Ser system radical SAM maturase HxsC [Dongia sp.]|uniref:His-Xaa-Ser system radical SAM maturase HxsC n=1 Tax=Dongia sp. TaxID=1977262 RepID=UPI0035AFA0DB